MTLSTHRGEILHFLDDPGESTSGESTTGESTTDGPPKPTWEYFADGALVVERGRVVACGAFDAVESAGRGGAVIHHHHQLLVPGFIDTHIHYPQCEIIAAYGTRLLEWLEQHTFPAEARFAARAHGDAVADFFLDELLRNGTTTALVFGTVHPQSVDAFFTAAESRNLRMVCGKAMMDRNAPKALCDTAQESFAESQALIDCWHGRGRLGYAVTPRFAPTSSARQLELAGALLVANPGVHLHTHLAESLDECAWVAALFPQSQDYLDVYDRHGLLGRRSVFAHGIHLSPREWARLAETDANIAFCPTSNLFIGSGLFPLSQADKNGVRVGLGTDVGGGDSFSLLRTANEAYKVQQLQQHNLSPLRALYFATLGGARALDLQQHIGNFAPGKEADFIALDYRATPLIEFRLATCKNLLEKLFVLLMLGDDRAVRETWIMGERRKPPDHSDDTTRSR